MEKECLDCTYAEMQAHRGLVAKCNQMLGGLTQPDEFVGDSYRKTISMQSKIATRRTCFFVNALVDAFLSAG